MFCSNCGKKVNENAEFCLNCGKSLNKQNNIANNQSITNDQGSTFGWGVLGWFVPLVGLILFCVWKQDQPRKAKAVGLGALISTCVNVVLVIIAFAFFSSVLKHGIVPSLESNAKCASAFCYSCQNGESTCLYYEDNDSYEYITCPCDDY